MLTDFQNFFTSRLSSKFLTKQWLNILPYLKRVATLPCEMFMLKNRNDPQLNEANFHARFSHSKHLFKNIHQWCWHHFVQRQKDIYSDHTEKTRRMTDCTQIPQPRRKTSRQNACAYKQRSVTDGISRRVTSGWHYISLILVDHGFKFNEAYYRNMMMLQYSSYPHTPRFQASSSSFSRTVPRRTVRFRQSTFPP